MRALQITSLGGPDAIELVDVAPPALANQVHIAVKAAGVSFPEVLQSRGEYQLKPELPFVPGAEVSGVVISAPETSEFSTGDRVAALPFLGGFAEEVTADPHYTFALPDSVSFEAGAAFIFNYGTAHFALKHRGQLQPGERVLVHGAAGGVGTASIQVAKTLGAAQVIAVVSTAAKGKIALDAGADEFVLADGFKDAVKAHGPVDVIVDPVGGDRFTDSLRCLGEGGRLLVIGFTGGFIPEVKVNRLLLNNIAVAGVSWGGYALQRPGFVKDQWNDMQADLESGALNPPIGPTFNFEQAADALKTLDERRATGKVLLIP